MGSEGDWAANRLTMTTPARKLWATLQVVLPSDEWMSLQIVYREMAERLTWDEDDLRSEVGQAKQRAWQRNIRNELGKRIKSGHALKNGKRPDYRLPPVGLRPKRESANAPVSDSLLGETVGNAPTGVARRDDREFGCVDLTEPPARHSSTVRRIVRNTQIVAELKVLYDDTCQRCETRLHLGDGVGYSEGHHLRPLGHPHDGPDRRENVLVVCPNCHALLDLAVHEITLADLTVLGDHSVSPESIDYHNRMVRKRRKENRK